jgi:di/tricarboxylate transporter
VANSVAGLAGSAGPQVVLVALMVLSSLLSQGLDGAPTVVLLGPVVVTTAQTLGLSPYPLMMAVSLAASAAFMTPFSHKANLLVMGAGGYRAMDYMKVGAPLTLAVFVLLALMIPLLMPF